MIEHYGRTASMSVRWQRARTHCSETPAAEGGIEIVGLHTKLENRRAAARVRNEQVDICNTRNWAQLPRRHHYDQIVPSNVHHLRCVRPNSGKECHVKTLLCNLNGKSPGLCKVANYRERKLWFLVLWFRISLCLWFRISLCHKLSSRGRQRSVLVLVRGSVFFTTSLLLLRRLVSACAP